MKKVSKSEQAAKDGRRPVSDGDRAADLAPEYTLRKHNAARNPFYAEVPAGGRRAVIAPDVAEVIADSAVVNEALRLLIKLARERHVCPVEPGLAYGGWLATLEPDVAAVFGGFVNDALRSLIELARNMVPPDAMASSPQQKNRQAG